MRIKYILNATTTNKRTQIISVAKAHSDVH